jgi:hypothetical protein
MIFMFLIDSLASCPPPLGQASQFAPFNPDAMVSAAIKNRATLAAEVDVAHPFFTHRTFVIEDLVLMTKVMAICWSCRPSSQTSGFVCEVSNDSISPGLNNIPRSARTAREARSWTR